MALRSVLVTGGAGFLGSAIVRALNQKHPDCVIAILDVGEPSVEVASLPNVSFVQASTTNADDVRHAFLACPSQVVIHSAGIVPPLSERYRRRMEEMVFAVNVEGTRNVVTAAKHAGCKAFVFTSSCCAVTDDMSTPYLNIDETYPTSPRSSIYGESKVRGEAIVVAANSDDMPTCVLRPSVLFGEGDNQLIPPIHHCIAKRETPYIVGDATNLWDVTYVGNVADAHVLAAENLVSSKTAAGEIFFIQNNEPIPFRDFSLQIWQHFGHTPPFELTIPQGLAWLMGLLSEWLTWVSGTPTTLSRGSVKDACSMRVASGQKARATLGFEPRVGIEEGIRISCQVLYLPLHRSRCWVEWAC